MGPLERALSATGTAGYDLLRVAHFKPSARGRIEALDVTVGARVVAGQRLAVLHNFELSAAQSKVASAAAAATAAAIALYVGLAAMGTGPALASNYHDHHPWAQTSASVGYAGRV